MNKKSKQREAIISVLRSTKSHPSAVWIYEEVKKEIPNVALATIYRNLRILKDSGEISEVYVVDDTALFDGNTQKHYHFRCDRCGKVLDLDEPVDTAIETKIANKTGLRVTHHHLELGGVCLDCQKLENNVSDPG